MAKRLRRPAEAAKFIGWKFGYWEAVGPVEHDRWGILSIPVRCICGASSLVSKSALLNGKSRSCPGCVVRPSKKPQGSAVYAHDLGKIKKGAAARGLAVEVGADYLNKLFEQQGRRCALSGVGLEPGARVTNQRKRHGRTMSLDRIDSARGYVEGNVQWTHKDINLAKQCLSNEQFLSMCLNVVVHMTGWQP